MRAFDRLCGIRRQQDVRRERRPHESRLDQPAYLLLSGCEGREGKVTEYAFSSGPPGTLRRAGIKKTDFKIGETVTVTGAPAKDGTKHLGWLKMIKYPDGRVFVYRDGSE